MVGLHPIPWSFDLVFTRDALDFGSLLFPRLGMLQTLGHDLGLVAAISRSVPSSAIEAVASQGSREFSRMSRRLGFGKVPRPWLKITMSNLARTNRDSTQSAQMMAAFCLPP
jgi:hypothetical protein